MRRIWFVLQAVGLYVLWQLAWYGWDKWSTKRSTKS